MSKSRYVVGYDYPDTVVYGEAPELGACWAPTCSSVAEARKVVKGLAEVGDVFVYELVKVGVIRKARVKRGAR